LDFSGDLYGKVVSVHFTRRLRGEKKFASPEELALQIKQDIQIVRESIRSTSFETVN
jgi:riboflavin kinase/FMN adenylyltransferase